MCLLGGSRKSVSFKPTVDEKSVVSPRWWRETTKPTPVKRWSTKLLPMKRMSPIERKGGVDADSVQVRPRTKMFVVEVRPDRIKMKFLRKKESVLYPLPRTKTRGGGKVYYYMWCGGWTDDSDWCFVPPLG